MIYNVLDTEATPTKLVQTRNVSARILPNFSLNFLWISSLNLLWISSWRLWAPSFIADPDGRGHFLWWNDVSTNQDPYFDIHSHSWAVFQNRLTQATRTRGRPVWQLVLVAVPSPPGGSHVNRTECLFHPLITETPNLDTCYLTLLQTVLKASLVSSQYTYIANVLK